MDSSLPLPSRVPLPTLHFSLNIQKRHEMAAADAVPAWLSHGSLSGAFIARNAAFCQRFGSAWGWPAAKQFRFCLPPHEKYRYCSAPLWSLHLDFGHWMHLKFNDTKDSQ